ncbi:MAG: 7-carboxy-7-deazaguanine synthase QueE [Cyclobacteriaceae bacterium]
MEQFYSIQGEGYHQGKAAHFIRLGGCDVGCHWCDVKESWNASAHPIVPIEKILEDIDYQKSDLVIVTGGEPLMYNLEYMCTRLHGLNLKSHVETSGTSALSGEWDWVTFSPKKFKNPLPIYYSIANELKVIVNNRSDLKWAEGHAAQVNTSCELYLQPEWTKRDKMMPLIMDYVRNNPKWRISLQVHKYLGVD